MPKLAKTEAAESPNVSVQALESARTHLMRLLACLEAGLDEDPGTGLHEAISKESCRVASCLATVTGELRAREKAERAAARDLDHALVMRHLRMLPSEKRARIADELIKMDDEDSVLA